MTYNRHLFILGAIATFVLLALAACGGTTAESVDSAVSVVPTSTSAAQATSIPEPAPTATTAVVSMPEPTQEPEPEQTVAPTEEANPTAEDGDEAVDQESGDDTAVTDQVDAGSDAISDEADAQVDAAFAVPETIAALLTETPTAAGDVVLIYGKVLDVNGNPVEGAAVEIWQTDANGIYDHPGDSGTNGRDRSFQFYGQSVADEEGMYAFRTVIPGRYEPRPRHIHVKVRIDGAELLTTQFYFEEDREALANEGLFAQAGSLGELLLLSAVDDGTANEDLVSIMTNDLIIDTGIGAGTLTLTPSQGEGPYYPVVLVADYDNDLALVP